ncbi:MAG: tRNA pseudouridine(38-40) synthase TruA [Nitrospinae bacterium]|nr:tRNA pseudouridine(38-40) synthase TruA [Nitrospinota bacterium]
MRTVKIVIEYEGSRYHGWQIQPNAITIQEVMESTLAKMVGEKVHITSSGRTDAGVHALAQVASFQTSSSLKDEKLMRGFNALLPDDIVITDLKTVDSEFNARFSAKSKLYKYVILNRSFPSALERRFCWFIPKRLDLAKMREGSLCLVGEHDFGAFCSSTSNAKSYVRKLTRLDIETDDDRIIFWLAANGFLKQMIRNIVGTLVQVGSGRIPPSTMKEILESKDRCQAGQTAHPEGLFLVAVEY